MNEYENVGTPGHVDYFKKVLKIVQTEYGDWRQRLPRNTAINLKDSNEPWRGKGKRRMPKKVPVLFNFTYFLDVAFLDVDEDFCYIVHFDTYGHSAFEIDTSKHLPQNNDSTYITFAGGR